MKRLFLSLATILLLVSCQPDAVEVGESSKADVTFTFASLTGNKSEIKAKNGSTKGDGEATYPECSDEDPFDAEITIDGVVYIVSFTDLGTGETEVLQLPANADNIVEEVVIYDQEGTPIYESPNVNSPEVTEGHLVGVPLDLELRPFYKNKIHIDVVCWQDYSFTTLTWGWFDIDYHQINTICFYGDVCTKYYEDFHEEGSPYFGQEYDGYDFPAIFQVIIHNGTTGEDVVADNVEWQGIGSPLCVEYMDNLQVDEDFSFEIGVYMPDGSVSTVYEAEFEDGIYSEEGNPNGFGGEDGIFVFNVGNCNSSGQNDLDAVFPAYLPLPSQAKFKIYGPLYSNGYVNLEVDGVSGSYVISNQVYEGWCGSKHNSISTNHWYDANIYSSLEGAVGSYSASTLSKLNWIANHTDGYTAQEIQAAIWAITDGEPANGLSTEADNHSGYVPAVGGYAFVIFDPIEDEDQAEIQLFIVRIDP